MDKNLSYTLSLKDLFSNKMKDAENATSRMDNKMSSLGSKLARFGAVVGVGALAKGIYDAGTNMDSLSVSLKTMLGNKKEADKLLADMITFAKTTPFQQDEVATAGKQLLAFGIEANKIIPTMTALGDVSSGLAQPIGEMAYLFGTIKTQGKAMTVDIRQFANRGVPIYEELAKVTGKSGVALQKFIEDGKVGFPEIEKAFQNMSGKGGKFFNLMGELSKTTGGQMSNLKDQLIGLAVTVFKLLQPAINAIIKGLQSLMGFITRNIDTIKTLSKVVMLLVGSFYIAKGILLATAIANGIMASSTLVVAANMGIATAAQYALNTAMAANPLGLVIAAIAVVILSVKELYNNLEILKGQFEAKASSATQSFFEGQIKQTRQLADEYERLGMSRKEAEGKAIATQSGKIDANMAKKFDRLKAGTLSKESFDIASNLASTAKKGLKGIFDKKGAGASTTSAGVGSLASKSSDTKTDGTEISGSKPQSLVIYITKLVESLNINTTNLKESSQRIREEVSKALLETVNDVNLIAR